MAAATPHATYSCMTLASLPGLVASVSTFLKSAQAFGTALTNILGRHDVL